MVALRKESVDRNLLGDCRDGFFERSLSARRAWIEIFGADAAPAKHTVALRKESVDRNCWRSHSRLPNIPVALRKESVDRNHDGMLKYRDAEVALRKESVDRNASTCFWKRYLWVALRKESVDRNTTCGIGGQYVIVALRKESVDRNPVRMDAACVARRRSPQGERG